MAFDLRNFQFNRGVITANAQGGGLTPVIHTYFSNNDSLDTVQTPGFFPPYIDGSPDKVFVNDCILVVGVQGAQVGLFSIYSVDPISLNGNTLTPAEISQSGVIFQYSGALTTPTFGAISFEAIGNQVTMLISALTPSAASNATTIISPAGIIPVGYRPTTSYTSDIVVVNNSVRTSAVYNISTAGTITIYASIAEASFTASGNAGFLNATAYYTASSS